MAVRVFLGSNDSFTIASNNVSVVGAAGTGTEIVKIMSGVGGVSLDANVERIELPGALSAYKFVSIPGTGIQVQNSDGSVVGTIPSLNQTTTIAFADGSAPLLQTGASSFSLGGQSVAAGTAAAIASGSMGTGFNTADKSTVGTGGGGGPITSDTYVLTTGLDTATANKFFASETYYNTDGKGPTINAGDNLTGTAGRTDNTLTITDLTPTATNGNIPAGVTLTNIQNIILNTSNNTSAGTGFSTVDYADVRSLKATTNGDSSDLFAAKNGAAGTVVDVAHNGYGTGGNITVVGGANVTAASKGGNVIVGSPGAGRVPLAAEVATGVVTVNQNSTSTGTVNVFGGSSVTVNVTSSSNSGAIDVGNTVTNTGNTAAGTIANTTGNISVNTAGTGNVTVFGGANVSVSDSALKSAGSVVVGDSARVDASNLPTGNVTITETAKIAYNGLAGSTNNNTAGGSIEVYGGKDVSITTNEANVVKVGNLGATKENALNPTGKISVTNTGVETIAAAGAIKITGGTDVTVQSTGSDVIIGRTANALIDQASNPTGNVSVTESMNGNGFTRSVVIDGGKDVTVNAKGQNVTIGQGVASAPVGAVTVTQSDMLTGTGAYLASTNAGNVTVDGGTTVTVNTTGGNVTVGAVIGGVNTVPTGAVQITRTFSGPGADTTSVQGGTTVAITTTKTSGSITVGNGSQALNAAGTALKDANLAPTGDVTIVDATTVGDATAYGTGSVNVNTNGAATVSLKGGDVDAINDIQATLATGGSGSGKAVGTSKLAKVIVDGQTGTNNITIASDALTDLSVLNNKGGANNVTITNNTAGHALTITQGGNNKTSGSDNKVTVIDAKAGSVTVTDNGSASSAVLGVTAAKATSLTVNNAATAIVNVAGDVELTTVTLKGAGNVTLQNVSTLGKIATVDASTSTGNVTADLTVTTVAGVSQKFTGGSGVTKLTVSTNAFSYGDAVVLAGGTGSSDVIVANYAAAGTDVAMGSTSSVKGFEILGLGANATGTYDATGFTGGVTVGAIAGAATLTNMAKNAPLAITAAPGSAITLTPSTAATNATNDALTINVNTNIADPVTGALPDGIANTVTANGYEAISIVSNGAGGNQQPTANTMTLLDTGTVGTGTLAISGQGKLTLTDTTTRVTSINVTNTSTVDVTGVVASNKGVAITGGTASVKAVGATGGTEVASIALDGTGVKKFAIGDTWVVKIAGETFTYTAAAADTMAQAATYMAAALTAYATTGPVAKTGAGVAPTALSVTASGGNLALTSTAAFQIYSTLGGANTGTVTSATNTLVGALEEQLITITTGTVAAGNTAVATINGTAATFTAVGGESASAVATGLAAAINALPAANKIGVNSAVASGATVIITGGTNGAFLSTAGATTTGGITTTIGAVANNYATANDSFTTGSGGGTYAPGLGGSWSNTVHKYSSGSETVNLAASTAKTDYIKLADGRVVTNNGTTGGMSGFTVGSMAASDALFFATAGKTQIANASVPAAVSTLTGAAVMAGVLDPSGALLTALGNLTFTLSNGVITFSATGGHSLSEFTTAQLISAAEVIVNSSSTGGANKMAVFSSGGNSYVVASDAGNTLAAGTDAKDVLVQLTGVASTTGFGYTGAQGAVVIANTVDGVTNAYAAVQSNALNTGSATVAVYDQAGFSNDAISALEFGTVSTSITNLAPSSMLTLNKGGTTAEAVTISQTGAAGMNSLTLVANGGDTFKAITTNGDGLLVINPTASTIINSLVDGGSTNTLATLVVANGGGTLDIKAITDTALTVVDSSAATAAVTLGSTSALTNAGMTFKLAVGQASTITASGAGDVFVQGVKGSLLAADAGTGIVTLTASGAGDVITLSNGANTITANGSGDVISVGTGTNTITATGANDTINIASGAGLTSVTVGTNATVNIGTLNVANAGAETINVTTAVTGDTAANAFAKTVINFANAANVAPQTEHHKISFDSTVADTFTLLGGSVAASQINVSTAASLVDALNMAANYMGLTQVQGAAATTATLAANTGKVDWFQYGGDTYVVAMVNSTGAPVAQTGLDANDVVVKLTGMVDLSGSTFAGEILTM